tara:strand:+ start:1689 stop:2471 length:783 start_codon:yes stop_codon:yes gene_type:complete
MNTIKDIRLLENRIRKIVSETKAGDIKQEIQAAYDAVKEVKLKLKELGKTNKETKVLKAAARKMVDELEDLEDLDMEEEMTEMDSDTIKRNEQSEGYGTFKGLGMNEGITKLTDRDLNRLLEASIRKKKLIKEVRNTYSLITRRIIKENIGGLKLVNYESLLNEQGQYNRDPGIAAAEGIEVIIDNLKKGWSMIKDSTTRKQIQNTLAKLNNFMMYSAELVGSGSSQRAPRSYDQIANPLPFPELDEPEELEDIDDEISM